MINKIIHVVCPRAHATTNMAKAKSGRGKEIVYI